MRLKLEISELTNELVARAYKEINMRPGDFGGNGECCPLEALAKVSDCHWTQVVGYDGPRSNFYDTWDRLSSKHWELLDDDSVRYTITKQPVTIGTEGGQRAKELFKFLLPHRVVVRLPDA